MMIVVLATAARFHIGFADMSLHRNLILLLCDEIVAMAAATQLNVRYAHVSLRRNLALLFYSRTRLSL